MIEVVINKEKGKFLLMSHHMFEELPFRRITMFNGNSRPPIWKFNKKSFLKSFVVCTWGIEKF